jgi:hypothetical protein
MLLHISVEDIRYHQLPYVSDLLDTDILKNIAAIHVQDFKGYGHMMLLKDLEGFYKLKMLIFHYIIYINKFIFLKNLLTERSRYLIASFEKEFISKALLRPV